MGILILRKANIGWINLNINQIIVENSNEC
jgi:hypothetical protein